jgi:hypothetical protein
MLPRCRAGRTRGRRKVLLATSWESHMPRCQLGVRAMCPWAGALQAEVNGVPLGSNNARCIGRGWPLQECPRCTPCASANAPLSHLEPR